MLSFLIVLTTMFQISSCECRQSHMTICDKLDDIKQDHHGYDTWTDLIIGADGSEEDKMKPVQLNELAYYFAKFRHLRTVIIIRQISSLISYYEHNDCEFPGIKLNYVSFYGNTLGHLERYIKFPLYKLETLSLVNNEIMSIKGGTFRFHEIKNFDASSNLIAVIEKYSLPSTNVTETIRLRNNKIATIEGRSFPSSLVILNMDNNYLSYIDRVALDNLVNLQELTLSHNRLEYLPYLSHMTKLHLLDVSYNAITTIDYQLQISTLIDLNHNLINDPNILQFINIKEKLMPKISLAFNRLTTLNLTNIHLRTSKVNVYGNPWDCEKWEELKKQLDAHETSCGREYFYSGKTPYCLNYQWQPASTISETEEDISRFYDAISSNAKLIQCDLKPKVFDIFPHCSWKNYD